MGKMGMIQMAIGALHVAMKLVALQYLVPSVYTFRFAVSEFFHTISFHNVCRLLDAIMFVTCHIMCHGI